MADEKAKWGRIEAAVAFEGVKALLKRAEEEWEAIKENAPKEIADVIRWNAPTQDKAELLALRLRADIAKNPEEPASAPEEVTS